MAATGRAYDIVLFGATGYTGQYTAEYIVTQFPTNFSWAIAGRSREKLQTLSQSLQKLNPDRKPPAIETVQLQLNDLRALTRKTKVLLNTVGPYALYGEPVVAACAENGTHYLDVTGESPWVKEMIDKYDAVAKESGAIIIPQIGLESAPAELVTYLLTSFLRNEAKVFTKDATVSLHKIKGSASGGTLTTVLTIFDRFSLREISRATSAQGMTSRPLAGAPNKSLYSRILGVTAVPDLGTLTTSIQASADIPIVHRSWDLLYDTAESYGPGFRFNAFMTTRNAFTGILTHLALITFPVLLLLPPIRWLVAKMVYQPGQGPAREDTKNHYVKYRGIATADSKLRQRALATMEWDGDIYHLCGVFLAEAARVLLSEETIMAKRLGGGLLTPATLGQAYIDRLTRAGVRFETRMLTNG